MKPLFALFAVATVFTLGFVGCSTTSSDDEGYTEYQDLQVAPETTESK